MGVSVPSFKSFAISCIVRSNGVSVPVPNLTASMPSTGSPARYTVIWRRLNLAESDPVNAPWEIVVEDQASEASPRDSAPQACPAWPGPFPLIPRILKCSPPPATQGTLRLPGRCSHRRDAGTRPVDWSVRLLLVSAAESGSQPRSPGVDARFVLPAGQVATLELVRRDNGEVFPLPGLAAFAIAAPDQQTEGTFRCVPQQSAAAGPQNAPRQWTLEIAGAGNKTSVGGVEVPEFLANYSGQISLWKALQADTESVHWAGPPSDSRPTLGLRIRTHRSEWQFASRNSAVGLGTNWLKALAGPKPTPPSDNPGG